ncbi:hypothetical protein GF357_00880 [Candidatus Dojkabacteria bacterium]|nr:hypothetical protein [Candidatus Dojkabacteria bacterium]
MLNLLLIPNKKNRFKPYLIRKFAVFVYTLIFAFVNFAPDFLFDSIPAASASSITSEKLVELTNVERRKYGLKELTVNSRLSSAAKAKANDMLLKQYWDHFGPSGETPWQFIEGADYKYIYAGENLAKGFSSAEGVHLAWMASQSHRKNIISGKFNEIGIAVVSGNLMDEEVVLVVQMFGNQTSEIQQASVKSVTEENFDEYQSIENGQIKSISIDYPAEGDVLTDPKARVQGVVDFEGRLPEYEVEVYSDDKAVGTVKSDNVNWEAEAEYDWSEGEHEVSASILGNSDISRSVKFTVDTYPPLVYDHDIFVRQLSADLKRKEGGAPYLWDVSVRVYEEVEDISIVVNDEIFTLKQIDDNQFQSQIEISGENGNLVESAVLMVSDSVGNIAEIDVTEKFLSDHVRDDAGVFMKAASFVTKAFRSVTVRSWINIGLAIFILALLIFEVYFYNKIGKLADNSMFLFFIGIWWLLIVFSIVVGFDGDTLQTGVIESVAQINSLP